MFQAWPCKQQQREKLCNNPYLLTSAACFGGPFSLHLSNEKRAPRLQERDPPDASRGPGSGRESPGAPLPSPPPFGSGRRTPSWRFLQRPGRTSAVKSRGDPHFRNAQAGGRPPGRRLERRPAKAESCIRNFPPRTGRLLSHVHGWRTAGPRAHSSLLGPGGG